MIIRFILFHKCLWKTHICQCFCESRVSSKPVAADLTCFSACVTHVLQVYTDKDMLKKFIDFIQEVFFCIYHFNKRNFQVKTAFRSRRCQSLSFISVWVIRTFMLDLAEQIVFFGFQIIYDYKLLS